ncbi:MAG TPA: thioesterase family protein [Mycobacteriales bacterium]|nr:thioesterase family protein [Mycobacteriales bacterium]
MTPEFVHPISVRYLEVDMQGVVFNMWYLAYVDDAMTAYLAARGMPYDELIGSGHDVQVVHAELDWRSGLRWATPAAVAVRSAAIGQTSFRLGFEFRRDGEPAVTAELVYVCISTEDGGKRPLPAALRAALA